MAHKPEDVCESALAFQTSSFADLLAQSQGTEKVYFLPNYIQGWVGECLHY